MRRLYIALFCLAALAVVAALIARIEGAVTVTLYGFEVRVVLSVVIAAFIAATLLVAGVLLAAQAMRRAVGRIEARRRARARTRGAAYLTRGFMALMRGELDMATRLAERSARKLPHQAMPLLLAAQAARLQNDTAQEAAHYRRLVEAGGQDEAFGLEGLFRLALHNSEVDEARRLAERGLAADRKCDWAIDGLVNLAARDGDWPQVLTLLPRLRHAGVPRAVLKSKQAVALVMQAEGMGKAGEARAAIAMAQKAVRAAPNAAAVRARAARILHESDARQEARLMLVTGWRKSPHPELAAAWRACHAGEPAEDNLRAVLGLIRHNKDHLESHLLRAALALDARKLTLARSILRGHAGFERPRMRVCRLMAAIEDAAGRAGKMREWQARAERAEGEAAWVCPASGRSYAEWVPISPQSGILNGLEWRPIVNKMVPLA